MEDILHPPGDTNIGYIASWYSGAWHALGNKLDNTVLSLAAAGSDLYVGGYFTKANPGDIDVGRVARWDGSAWNAMTDSAGHDGVSSSGESVNALVWDPTHQRLYLGGGFIYIHEPGGDNIPAPYVASWTPATSTWSTLTSGGSNGFNQQVRAMELDTSNNTLFVAGDFDMFAGTYAPVRQLALWDTNTNTWGTLSSSVGGHNIMGLTFGHKGLYAVGRFTRAGSSPAMGVAWYQPTANWPNSLKPLNNTNLKAGTVKQKISWKVPTGQKSKNIRRYEVQVSNYSDFSTLLLSKNTSKTSLTVTGLLPVTTYYWRVRAIFKGTGGAADTPGNWSAANILNNFQTVFTKAPAQKAPGNNAKQIKPTVKLTWKKPAGCPVGTTYTLQYSNDQITWTSISGLLTTSYTLDSVAVPVSSPVPGVTTWYWRVKAQDATGSKDYSPWQTTPRKLRR